MRFLYKKNHKKKRKDQHTKWHGCKPCGCKARGELCQRNVPTIYIYNNTYRERALY